MSVEWEVSENLGGVEPRVKGKKTRLILALNIALGISSVQAGGQSEPGVISLKNYTNQIASIKIKTSKTGMRTIDLKTTIYRFVSDDSGSRSYKSGKLLWGTDWHCPTSDYAPYMLTPSMIQISCGPGIYILDMDSGQLVNSSSDITYIYKENKYIYGIRFVDNESLKEWYFKRIFYYSTSTLDIKKAMLVRKIDPNDSYSINTCPSITSGNPLSLKSIDNNGFILFEERWLNQCPSTFYINNRGIIIKRSHP